MSFVDRQGRLKDFAFINENSLSASTDEDYLIHYVEISNVDSNGVISEEAIEAQRFEDAPSRARRRVKAGSTIISSVRPNLQAMAYFGKVDQNLICSTGFNVVTPRYNYVSGRFLYYVLKADRSLQYFVATAKGVGYPAVDEKDFNTLEVRLPVFEEQTLIVQYLDQTCKAIDHAIAVKQRQLEKLDQLRKSIIYKAVTKGLDDSVVMRKSGAWFDNVPRHWQIKRLKDVAQKSKRAIKVGPFGSQLKLADMTEEGDVKVYNQRTVIDKDFSGGNHYISEEKYEGLDAFTVFSGDLLISTRGTIGRCVAVPNDAELGILHPCLMRVQTEEAEMLPEYLAVLIEDSGFILRQLSMMSAATTIEVIYSESLKRTYLPVPPVEEQKEILRELARQNEKIDTLVNNIQDQRGVLNDYKKSLIHECVTGKCRITEADLKDVA